LHSRRLGHQAPDLDALDEVAALLPVPILQRLARLHNMVPRALRRASEHLAVRKVQQTTERFRDHLPPLLLRVDARQQRDLNKHALHKERSFEQLGVDVHVERKLALLLRLLLLGAERLEALLVDALGEQLLDALRGEDLLERRLRLLDEAEAERAETE